MSYKFSDPRFDGFEPYEPETGSFKIKADANESFIEPTAAMRERLAEIVRGDFDFTRYPDPMARGLCAAYAEYIGVPPEYVTAGNGGDELIALILGALLKEGDGLLTFPPDFSMYSFYANLYGLRLYEGCKSADWDIDLEAAAALVRGKGIRAVLLSNPCNPTGRGIARERIARFAAEAHTLVIIDEAYMDFYGQSVADLAPQSENLIVLRTASKAFGLASLRLGFMVAPEYITRIMRNIKSPFNVSAMDQRLGEAVIGEPGWGAQCVARIVEGRRDLYSRLSAVSGVRPFPSDGNFVLLETKDAAAVQSAMKRRGVCVRKISGTLLRITAQSPEVNAQIIEALQAATAEVGA